MGKAALVFYIIHLYRAKTADATVETKVWTVLQTLQLTVLPCEYTTVHLSLELEALSRD